MGYLRMLDTRLFYWTMLHVIICHYDLVAVQGLGGLHFGNDLDCQGNVSIDHENEGQLIVPEWQTNKPAGRLWITEVTIYSTVPGLQYQLCTIGYNDIMDITPTITMSQIGVHIEVHVLPIPLILDGWQQLGVYCPGEVPIGYCDIEGEDYRATTSTLSESDHIRVSTYKKIRGRQYMMSVKYEQEPCHGTSSLDTRCDTDIANDTTPGLITTEDLVYGKCLAGCDGLNYVWITNITFYSVSPGLTFHIVTMQSNKVLVLSEGIQTTHTGLVTHQLVKPLQFKPGYEFLGFYFPGLTAFGYCTNGTDIHSVTSYPLQIRSELPGIHYLEVVHGRRYPMMIGTAQEVTGNGSPKHRISYLVVALSSLVWATCCSTD